MFLQIYLTTTHHLYSILFFLYDKGSYLNLYIKKSTPNQYIYFHKNFLVQYTYTQKKRTDCDKHFYSMPVSDKYKKIYLYRVVEYDLIQVDKFLWRIICFLLQIQFFYLTLQNLAHQVKKYSSQPFLFFGVIYILQNIGNRKLNKSSLFLEVITNLNEQHVQVC